MKKTGSKLWEFPKFFQETKLVSRTIKKIVINENYAGTHKPQVVSLNENENWYSWDIMDAAFHISNDIVVTVV